jgi:hypothetical protein
MAARRIESEEARREVGSGDALLVCAYDDEEKCQQYRLTNAISLAELKAQEAALPKDRKIFFYCA